MTNYQHGWKAVDPEEGKKYRVSVVEKYRADAGAIKSWHIYTVKHCIHSVKLGEAGDTLPVEEVLFKEHPLTWYKAYCFSFYPLISSTEDAAR